MQRNRSSFRCALAEFLVAKPGGRDFGSKLRTPHRSGQQNGQLRDSFGELRRVAVNVAPKAVGILLWCASGICPGRFYGRSRKGSRLGPPEVRSVGPKFGMTSALIARIPTDAWPPPGAPPDRRSTNAGWRLPPDGRRPPPPSSPGGQAAVPIAPLRGDPSGWRGAAPDGVARSRQGAARGPHDNRSVHKGWFCDRGLWGLTPQAPPPPSAPPSAPPIATALSANDRPPPARPAPHAHSGLAGVLHQDVELPHKLLEADVGSSGLDFGGETRCRGAEPLGKARDP